jgi:hypothetical protein
VTDLATYDTGDWREVARVELDPPGTLAVFQRDEDADVIRYVVFRRSGKGHWYGQYQSGHFPTIEEAVADVVQWRD